MAVRDHRLSAGLVGAYGKKERVFTSTKYLRSLCHERDSKGRLHVKETRIINMNRLGWA